jgi:hypothetical protein
MALKSCPECSKEVSSDATRCPHCGKRLKMGLFAKLLLAAVALFVLFMGFGLSIPDNVAKANAARRVCEREFMPKGMATQYDCDKAYDDAKAGH